MKVMLSLVALLLVATTSSSNALSVQEPETAEFLPAGSDIALPPGSPGPTSFGATVVLKGSRLAVGHPVGKGSIRVYDFVNDDWTLVRTFDGEPGDNIGKYFDMSADGSRMAIRQKLGNKSSVQLYNVDNGARIGQYIHCGSVTGKQVSLAADGKTIAVSCEDFGNNRGLVKFFYLASNGAWFLKGKNLEGLAVGARFGTSTSLSANGDRVAIGTPTYSVGGLRDRGFAAVYDYNETDNEWQMVWDPIVGDGLMHRLGSSVSLSGNGRNLVVSASGVAIRNVGKSYVGAYFDFQATSQWSPMGQVFESENEVFDGPLEINDSGTRFGVTSSLVSSTDLHRIRIYDLKHGVWNELLEPIDWAAGPNDNARTSFSLDDDRFAFATTNQDTEPVVKVLDIVTFKPTPPTSAPAPPIIQDGDYLPGWGIEIVNIIAEFGDQNPTDQVKAIYEFDEHPFDYSVFELDCATPVSEEYIQADELFSQTPDGKYRIEINLDINTETIASSPVYEDTDEQTATMAFCLRVDLFDEQSGDLVPAVSERNRLSIEIDTSKDFELRHIEVQNGNVIDFNLRTSLDYDVQACQCDDALECMESPVLYEFAETHICIQAIDPTVEIASVQELVLMQDQGLTQYTVRNGEEIKPFSSMQRIGETVVVSVRPLAAFFQGLNPVDVLAVGICALKFKSGDSDRLLRGRIMSGRSDEENEDSTMFDVEFQLGGRNKDSHSSGMLTNISLAASFVAAVCFFLA